MRRRVVRSFSRWTGARTLAIACGLALCSLLAHAQRGPHEWLTWGGDIERTGWNRAESALSKKTVGQLVLKWKTQIDKQVPIDIESGASMLTGPLVAQGVRTPQGTKTLVYTLAAVQHAGRPRRRHGRGRLAAQGREHRRTGEPGELDLHEYLDGHARDRQGQRHHLHDCGGWPAARHGSRHGRAQDDRRVRAALLAQLEPEPRGRLPLHHRWPRVRQRATTREPPPDRHRVRTARWPWRRT